MQHDKHGSGTDPRDVPHQKPGSHPPDQASKIFKASSRHFFDDELLDDDPERTIIRKPRHIDISSLEETMKMPTVSRLIRTAQPVTYEELDERLEDDLDFGR